MRELAVRHVDRTPRVVELDDRVLLPREQPMDRVAARTPVRQRGVVPASLPAPQPATVQLEHPSGPPEAPPGVNGVIDHPEQRYLHGLVNTRWDRPAQPQLDFPRSNANSTACSITTMPNRSTSACSFAASDTSALLLRRPGFDAVNAAIAPSFAVLRKFEIVERSTPASAAACDGVICSVSIRTHKSYFGLS